VKIDVTDYLDEDEENNNCLYLDVNRLTEDILNDLNNHPTYKDYWVEVTGVERWEH